MTQTLQQILGDDLVCYLHASDLSSLGNDDEIETWTDRVSGIDFEEGTRQDQPLYKSNYNGTGYPAVDFSEDDMRLTGSHASLDLASGWVVLLAIAGRNTTTHLTPLSQYNNLSSYVRIKQNTSGWYLQDAGGFVGAVAFDVDDSSSRSVFAVRYQSNRVCAIGLNSDGEHLNVANFSSSGTPVHGSTWHIGRRGDDQQFFSGALHAMAIVKPTAARCDILRAATQLRYDWGLNDSDPEPEAASGGGAGASNPFRSRAIA